MSVGTFLFCLSSDENNKRFNNIYLHFVILIRLFVQVYIYIFIYEPYSQGRPRPTGPIAIYWVPRWSCLLLAVQVHTTHSRFYREQLNPHLLRRSCLYMLVYEIPGSDWIFNKWRCVNMKTNRDFLSGSKRDESNVA